MCRWQASYGRHDLPWQTPDPYRVWLSEVMLQQTQVATVLPAFQRFVSICPDVASLARADLDTVLGLWSGLGYYSRARNLHRAARIIADAGCFPDTIEGWRALPGVGRSTAGAVWSLAFGRPAAILDGNVKRVLARHAGIEGWPGDSVTAARLWREAESRVPATECATYTQGLMDLGATLCHRRRPDCAACPVGSDCVAHRDQRVAELPAARPRRDRAVVALPLQLHCDAHRVWLQQRPQSGVWGGLWCLPEGAGGIVQRTLRHDLTHRRLEIAVMRASSDPSAEHGGRWFDWTEVWQLGLPKPVRDILVDAHQSHEANARSPRP
ncbi:MAG: A/G-specific adenine glycosylase [Betaproteobacteria bacterium]|nr:A/G-specific adenine glycosylase [Betaproteobacteria bacterium]